MKTEYIFRQRSSLYNLIKIRSLIAPGFAMSYDTTGSDQIEF
jgi:hypothetical protein